MIAYYSLFRDPSPDQAIVGQNDVLVFEGPIVSFDREMCTRGFN